MRTNDVEMIPGNVDPKVMTYRKDLHCFHVLCETRLIDPRQPTFPIIRKRIVVFRPMDYRTYFEGNAENNIHYMKVMNFQACSLVWDPCKEGAKELDAKVKAEHAALREASGENNVLKAKEGRRKATIGDIERLTK